MWRAWWRHQVETFSAVLAICARGVHRSPVNSPHKGQWRGALMFSLVWINDWVNNRQVGDLRRYRPHSDVTVIVSLQGDAIAGNGSVALAKLLPPVSNGRSVVHVFSWFWRTARWLHRSAYPLCLCDDQVGLLVSTKWKLRKETKYQTVAYL